MFKKVFIFSIVFLCSLFFFFQTPIPMNASASKKMEINFFYSPTCPHCAKESKFLDYIEKKYPRFEINRFNITENIELVKSYYLKTNVPERYWGSTPITFINGKVFLGFDESKSSIAIEEYLLQITNSCLENETADTEKPTEENCIEPEKNKSPEIAQTIKNIKIPLIGQVDLSNFSLISLTVIIGTLDGFNACAMLALGFLLAVLVATGVRKRIFWIGGTFILVSGIIYFLFISAWLNLFLFVGYLKIISFIVGILIILFAIFLLKDYFSGVVCKLCNIDPTNVNILTTWQRKLFASMNKLISLEMSLPITLLGVALVAAGINLVELVCSLGFPMAYAKILASFNLSHLSYYGYLILYVFFYMLDDFIIFIITATTLRLTNFGDKYLKAVKLISGIVLLIMGIIMLFKPEILSLS